MAQAMIGQPGQNDSQQQKKDQRPHRDEKESEGAPLQGGRLQSRGFIPSRQRWCPSCGEEPGPETGKAPTRTLGHPFRRSRQKCIRESGQLLPEKSRGSWRSARVSSRPCESFIIAREGGVDDDPAAVEMKPPQRRAWRWRVWIEQKQAARFEARAPGKIQGKALVAPAAKLPEGWR